MKIFFSCLSKIEKLEAEIHNISNRAQYCEKECNDYKKSLIETQEKLLEATKRLNDVRYFVSHSQIITL